MSNQKILYSTFAESLQVKIENISDGLTFNSINEWDSVAHMALVAALEDKFDVIFDTDEIIDMSSVAKAAEILTKHGIEFS